MSGENQQPNPPLAPPNPERKSLDDRAKMTELERIGDSCAHVLATAILRLWPEAQCAYPAYFTPRWNRQQRGAPVCDRL